MKGDRHQTTPSTFFFPAQIQAHFIPSGTRLAREQIRPTGNGPRYMHSAPQGKSVPCLQREPTGRAIIVIVIEQRRREPTRESERRKERERQTDRDSSRLTFRDAPVCAVKTTMSCVTQAFWRYTRERCFQYKNNEKKQHPRTHTPPHTRPTRNTTQHHTLPLSLRREIEKKKRETSWMRERRREGRKDRASCERDEIAKKKEL